MTLRIIEGDKCVEDTNGNRYALTPIPKTPLPKQKAFEPISQDYIASLNWLKQKCEDRGGVFGGGDGKEHSYFPIVLDGSIVCSEWQLYTSLSPFAFQQREHCEAFIAEPDFIKHLQVIYPNCIIKENV